MINWSADLPPIKPKYVAIMQLIKTLIQTDQLLPGQRLPAERDLAQWFQVDRSTVSRALNDLATSGLLEKRRGSGTFVAKLAQLKPRSSNINWQLLLNPANQATPVQEKLIQARALDHGQLIDGAADELPAELIPRLGSLDFNWQAYLLAQEQELTTTGYRPLVNALGKRQSTRQRLDLTQQSLIISGGAEQSLLLILSSLVHAGEAVAFATPSYFNATAVFQILNVRTFGVTVDQNGVDLNYLEQIILKHRIKLLILNPTYENPTGATLTLEQRQAVLHLCQRYQIPIVEDDVFGWLVAPSDDVPTLKALAPANVIYISSLSKLLGSSTRIGWIMAPQVIGQRLLQVQKQLDMIPSTFAQMIASLALNSPDFPTELRRLTATLIQRRQAVAKIFHRYRPDWHFNLPQGGFYLWVTQTDSDIFNHLLALDILVKPGTHYGADRRSFRFNVAGMNDRQLALLAQRLQEPTPH